MQAVGLRAYGFVVSCIWLVFRLDSFEFGLVRFRHSFAGLGYLGFRARGVQSLGAVLEPWSFRVLRVFTA